MVFLLFVSRFLPDVNAIEIIIGNGKYGSGTRVDKHPFISCVLTAKIQARQAGCQVFALGACRQECHVGVFPLHLTLACLKRVM